MADEAPQQSQASAGGGPAGAEPAAETSPPSGGGGIGSYLPLIIAIVLMPVAAWVTLEVKTRMDKKKAAAPPVEEEQADAKAEAADSHGDSHGGGGHGAEKTKGKAKVAKRNPRLPIPLTREAIAFVGKDPTKPGDFDKFVVIDIKGDMKEAAHSDKVVVNLANAGGTRFAVARLSLVGDHPEIVDRINENRERLLDIATGTLSSKSPDDVEKPGFRNILRSELLALFNQSLGSAMISEVIITEFVTQ